MTDVFTSDQKSVCIKSNLSCVHTKCSSVYWWCA